MVIAVTTAAAAAAVPVVASSAAAVAASAVAAQCSVAVEPFDRQLYGREAGFLTVKLPYFVAWVEPFAATGAGPETLVVPAVAAVDLGNSFVSFPVGRKQSVAPAAAVGSQAVVATKGKLVAVDSDAVPSFG